MVPMRKNADPAFRRQVEVMTTIWKYPKYKGTREEAWDLAGRILNSDSADPELWDSAEVLAAKEAFRAAERDEPEFFGS